MSKKNLFLGQKGEELAVQFLKEKGYKILRRNFKTKLGEIDIVAFDRDTHCFVEVKTRNSLRYGPPQEAVSFFKQRQMSKAALVFLKEYKLLECRARFDVVSVDHSQNPPKLDLIKNAFELEETYVI
ncbi:MAG: YraN family protein [Candidatus Omnitrophota bacterium]